MSALPDHEIRRLALEQQMLEPFAEAMDREGVISNGLTHAGYDLRLGTSVEYFKNTYCLPIDPKRFKRPDGSIDHEYKRQLFDLRHFKMHEPVPLAPHSYVLAYSLEYIRMPRNLKGQCVGKSTYARCGIIVNTTPLEPGWEGHLTIEIANTSPCEVWLYAGEGIAQLGFELLLSEPEVDYAQKKGKYNKQGPEPTTARTKT